MSQRSERTTQVTGHSLLLVSSDFKEKCSVVFDKLSGAETGIHLEEAHYVPTARCDASFQVIAGTKVDVGSFTELVKRFSRQQGLSARVLFSPGSISVTFTRSPSAWRKWLGLTCVVTGLFLTFPF